jgi:hypothetical protein
MSKVTVNRRGPSVSVRNVTLRNLNSGETFRFPRSRPGTVYQLLSVSDRAIDESGVDTGDLRFLYANVATGQVFGDTSNHVVVPVDCTMTVRERTVSQSTSSTRSARKAKTARRSR